MSNITPSTIISMLEQNIVNILTEKLEQRFICGVWVQTNSEFISVGHGDFIYYKVYNDGRVWKSLY